MPRHMLPQGARGRGMLAIAPSDPSCPRAMLSQAMPTLSRHWGTDERCTAS